MALFRTGGGMDGPRLIGSVSVTTTNNTTMTLTENLSKYKYVYLTESSYNLNADVSLVTYAKSLIKTSYLKNNAITIQYATGGDGSMYRRTLTLTYLTETTIRFKASYAATRNYGLYGIK